MGLRLCGTRDRRLPSRSMNKSVLRVVFFWDPVEKRLRCSSSFCESTTPFNCSPKPTHLPTLPTCLHHPFYHQEIYPPCLVLALPILCCPCGAPFPRISPHLLSHFASSSLITPSLPACPPPTRALDLLCLPPPTPVTHRLISTPGGTRQE